MSATGRPLRIAILAHEFLINIGANDFLKNIIRGLALNPQAELIFLCPRPHERVEHMVPASLKHTLKNIPYLKEASRALLRFMAPAADRIVSRTEAGEYDFYREACPRMEFLVCELSPAALSRLKVERQIDVFLPSIHILPRALPHVNYWPDCQPKHFPEFFDAESQRVRDQRIRGLLASGKPMIINSRDAKRDMQRFYGADADQVFELPFAPIVEFAKLSPHPELTKPYALPRPYFIVCNQFWVHKSSETAIKAAHIARSRGLQVDMVFTGRMEEPRKPGYIDGLRKMVKDLDLADTVRFLDYIPKDHQLELMKGAIAVIQPTLFEGGPGGGAVYDAVSLGVRAIVSDIPINHELPLDPQRLVLFEPRNAEELADRMQAFIDQPYQRPTPEDLYQQCRRSTETLSARLYEAIDRAMSESPASAATAATATTATARTSS